ncbi:hypothetical protein [Homoserinibacter sp. GY 40078]|uniref:hypothetical protein n=1 Tax=Homoserinibacter sp. GY 40078 TaxID=2603275 RepID=UPI0011CC6BB0|nr:hypothetical protein [Homoserinibacter sp. GY 40078]
MPPAPSDDSTQDDHAEAAPRSVRRVRRRVTTDPPPGSDPHPDPEPTRHGSQENDERMRRDKPPHY